MLFKPILKKSTMYVRNTFPESQPFCTFDREKKKRATLTQQFRAGLWGTDQASF